MIYQSFDRAAALLTGDAPRANGHGYIDVLPAEPPITRTRGQEAMQSTWLPLIYERLWRPIGFRVWVGADTEEERRRTRALLASQPGDAVLDVACGPGNTTRRLARDVGDDGLAVGLDASATMLAQAVHDTADARIAYVRGDAEHLPFREETFDGVACHGALYLIGDPFAAIAEQVRVLKPGGRIALLTSCHRGPAPLRLAAWAITHPGGVRVFGAGEITRALERHGMVDVTRHVSGFSQLVGARKPDQ